MQWMLQPLITNGIITLFEVKTAVHVETPCIVQSLMNPFFPLHINFRDYFCGKADFENLFSYHDILHNWYQFSKEFNLLPTVHS